LKFRVDKCVSNVIHIYVQNVTNHKFAKHLGKILGTDNVYCIGNILAHNNDFYVGFGGYGLILKKNKQNLDKQVMKISFGSGDDYNPMARSEMPYEYCVGLQSPTAHILKPIVNSFQAINLPENLFHKRIQIRNSTLHFRSPAVYNEHYFRDQLIEIPPVVPMFEMPLCDEVIWSETITRCE